ncbi:ROK family transcriptional regulator [Isoptericola cucumis]|uniref:Sugar kinase n=2 Tax=Isoptericola cucumis TaxID=1776856 RepID=A0ABQ2BAU7_9MICO|nr:ROK family transcriptional regulator [Isoptericola cucumis]GGI12157.1 sugar kinase [Isoptericola cucumis]
MQRRAEIPALGSLGSSARAVVRALLLAGPLSRAELARRLERSPASLTKITRPLLDSGLIQEETAPLSESRGRPGAPLTLDASRHRFIGVKVTAGEVYGVRADAAGRVEASAHRPLVDVKQGTVVGQIVHLVKELAEPGPVQALGVGLAGQMSRFDRTVRSNAYLGWDEVPLARLLEQATGIPTVLSGDARALTAGVQWSGPGRGLSDFAVLTVGVGVGLGIVLEDRVLAGPTGKVGMLGHHRVSDSGPLCTNGHRGCASAFLTTDAITRGIGVPLGRTDLDLETAFRLAEEGDDVALRVFADAGHALGVLIAELVNILGLPAVILAGDGLGMLAHVRPRMDAALAEHLDPNATTPSVVPFTSGFDEWARGAAVVACQWMLVDPPSPALEPA